MNTPFIRNHQYNVIKKQTDFLQKTLRTVADRNVLKTVRYRAAANIIEAIPDLTNDQQQMLEQITTFESAYDFQRYLSALEPCLEPFPPITLKQIQKLFPKNKKLKVPDLGSIDFRYVTYLSWVDIATNKLFIVYPFEGQFIGIEEESRPLTRKGTACSVIVIKSLHSSRLRPSQRTLRRIIFLLLASTYVWRAMLVIRALPI